VAANYLLRSSAPRGGPRNKRGRSWHGLTTACSGLRGAIVDRSLLVWLFRILCENNAGGPDSSASGSQSDKRIH